ncbi:MAG: type II toxin-antitoxin system RelE/ParE family toxin [Oceanospirillaceae bacterium]
MLVTVEDMERGLIDANQGGHVFKKRVGLAGKGKRKDLAHEPLKAVGALL